MPVSLVMVRRAAECRSYWSSVLDGPSFGALHQCGRNARRLCVLGHDQLFDVRIHRTGEMPPRGDRDEAHDLVPVGGDEHGGTVVARPGQ